ncbi:hypothetical protein [uncultured Roseovarius sp.]|nr:hypothetical protein [uncultured Roseovarius sp.]
MHKGRSFRADGFQGARYGELSWALETDKIEVSHSNRYIETDTTEHEGL